MILVVCLNFLKVKEKEKGKGRGKIRKASKLSYESSDVQKKYEKMQCYNICVIACLWLNSALYYRRVHCCA
jgi:hypothetical protein